MQSTNSRVLGKVKWFNEKKGYGFIVANSQDYFVHVTQIPTSFKTLKENQAVSFVPRQGKKGVEAQEVHLVTGKVA